MALSAGHRPPMLHYSDRTMELTQAKPVSPGSDGLIVLPDCGSLPLRFLDPQKRYRLKLYLLSAATTRQVCEIAGVSADFDLAGIRNASLDLHNSQGWIVFEIERTAKPGEIVIRIMKERWISVDEGPREELEGVRTTYQAKSIPERVSTLIARALRIETVRADQIIIRLNLKQRACGLLALESLAENILPDGAYAEYVIGPGAEEVDQAATIDSDPDDSLAAGKPKTSSNEEELVKPRVRAPLVEKAKISLQKYSPGPDAKLVQSSPFSTARGGVLISPGKSDLQEPSISSLLVADEQAPMPTEHSETVHLLRDSTAGSAQATPIQSTNFEFNVSDYTSDIQPTVFDASASGDSSALARQNHPSRNLNEAHVEAHHNERAIEHESSHGEFNAAYKMVDHRSSDTESSSADNMINLMLEEHNHQSEKQNDEFASGLAPVLTQKNTNEVVTPTQPEVSAADSIFDQISGEDQSEVVHAQSFSFAGRENQGSSIDSTYSRKEVDQLLKQQADTIISALSGSIAAQQRSIREGIDRQEKLFGNVTDRLVSQLEQSRQKLELTFEQSEDSTQQKFEQFRQELVRDLSHTHGSGPDALPAPPPRGALPDGKTSKSKKGELLDATGIKAVTQLLTVALVLMVIVLLVVLDCSNKLEAVSGKFNGQAKSASGGASGGATGTNAGTTTNAPPPQSTQQGE